MSSDTSSEIKSIKYLDKHGNQLDTKTEVKRQTTEVKRQSSDTDYHFGLIANQDKIFNLKSESSDLDNIVNSSEIKLSSNSNKSSNSKNSFTSNSSKKSNSSSQPRIDNINLNSPNYNYSMQEIKTNGYMSPTNTHHQMPSTNTHGKIPSTTNTQMPTTNTQMPSTNTHAQIPTSNNTFIPNMTPTNIPIANLTPQEIRMKKIELLRRLSEIKSKGYSLTKEYDFNSSIDEMEYEYALLKSFADKRNGVKIYKSILLNGISLMEFLNDKYDPFDFQLKGWSEHMSVEVDSYEDIFEELYEKYKSTGKGTPPEIRLILLILASGAAFHFSRTQLGGIPGISTAATGMINKMMSKPKKDSQYMSAQEINLEKQKQILRDREKELKQQKINNKTSLFTNQKTQFNDQQFNQQPSQFNQQPSQFNQQPSQFNQQSSQFNQQPSQFNQQPSQFNQQLSQFNQQPFNNQYNENLSMSRDIPDIRAPENVQEILSRIKHINQNHNNLNNTTETQEESTINERLISDSTLSENKKRGRKPKKSLISINTN